MGGADGCVGCCFFFFFVMWAIGGIMSVIQAAAQKDFLVKSSAMETLAKTLDHSRMVHGLLAPPGSETMMYKDVKENFKDVSCIPPNPPYATCSFKTGIKGNGNTAGVYYPMKNGGRHAFAGNFSWGEVTTTVDVRKNCRSCNDMSISKLEIDFHAKSQWEEFLLNAGKSVVATLAANAGQFVVVEAFNAIFGLEGKSRITHEGSVVIVNDYEFLRVTYFITQDHDGDGDIEDAEGWNRIVSEVPMLIKGGEVMGMFSTSGDLGIGHHIAAHAGAFVGMGAAKEALDGIREISQEPSPLRPNNVDL